MVEGGGVSLRHRLHLALKDDAAGELGGGEEGDGAFGGAEKEGTEVACDQHRDTPLLHEGAVDFHRDEEWEVGGGEGGLSHSLQHKLELDASAQSKAVRHLGLAILAIPAVDLGGGGERLGAGEVAMVSVE